MRFSPKTAPFLSRRSLSLSLAAAVALVLADQTAHAASLTWDGNGETADVTNGGGIWNTSTLNWWDGIQNVQWNNSTPDSAIFGGTGTTGAAGTVTLGSDITVDDLTFSTAGYTIAGDAGNAFTLTLSNTVIGGTASAIISANLAGTTGLTITNTNAEGIILSGNNTYSGITKIGTGSSTSLLRADSAGALGNSNQITVATNASLRINTTDSSFGLGKTLSIAGNGIGNSGGLHAAAGKDTTWAGTLVLDSGARVGGLAKSTLNLTGPIVKGAAGALSISAYGSGADTGVVIISGTQNTYDGATGIVRGILKLGAENALPTGTTLDVDSSTAAEDSTFDLNGFNQTIGALQRGGAATGGGSFVTNNGATAATLTVNNASTLNTTFSGIIRNGTSLVALTKSNSGTLTLTGANTYTGTTTVNAGTLQLNGAGALASANFQLNGGSFTIDNATTNNNTRIADTSDFTLNGGAFVYKGSTQASTNSSETVRNLTLAGGLSTVSVQFGGTNTATVSANQLSRAAGGGAALINGANLGSANSTSAGRLLLATAPTLVGTTDATTGINSGAKNTKIVPYLLGEAAASTGGAGTATGTPNTFLTYNPTTGLRPLNPVDEFSSTVVTGANVRLTGDNASTSSATINSLIMAADTDKNLNINSGQTLTIASGALLFVNSNRINGGTLNFGNTEGIVTVNAGKIAIFTSLITGTQGMSVFGPGTLGLGNSGNTYSGTTTLHSGIIVPQVSSSGNGSVISGPFGTSTVVFAGSQLRTTGTASEIPTTIGNAIRVQADTSFIGGGGSDFDFTGNVTLSGGTRTLTNTSGKNIIFSGTLGDGEQGYGLTIAGNNTGSVILSGSIEYSGPTTVNSGILNISGFQNLSGSISGSAPVSVNNPGTLVLSGLSPFFGGEGRIGNLSPLTLGNAGGNGGATLKIDNSKDTVDGAIFQETLGSLTLANNAVLDLGSGEMGTILEFAESQGNLWSGTLSIYNWTGTVGVGGGTDQIFFGDDQFGLTASQLAQITFYSGAGEAIGQGALLENGELIAVATIPEPSSMLSLFAMFGGLLGGRRLRRRSSVVA